MSTGVRVGRSLLDLCFHCFQHPLRCSLGDLLNDVVHLETQALNLPVPGRKRLSCCGKTHTEASANVSKVTEQVVIFLKFVQMSLFETCWRYVYYGPCFLGAYQSYLNWFVKYVYFNSKQTQNRTLIKHMKTSLILHHQYQAEIHFKLMATKNLSQMFRLLSFFVLSNGSRMSESCIKR